MRKNQLGKEVTRALVNDPLILAPTRAFAVKMAGKVARRTSKRKAKAVSLP